MKERRLVDELFSRTLLLRGKHACFARSRSLRMGLLRKKTLAPINWWPQDRCAKAFWSQHEMPAYQELLADTVAWLEPRPGQRWIDLGCGGGRLSRASGRKAKAASPK